MHQARLRMGLRRRPAVLHFMAARRCHGLLKRLLERFILGRPLERTQTIRRARQCTAATIATTSVGTEGSC